MITAQEYYQQIKSRLNKDGVKTIANSRHKNQITQDAVEMLRKDYCRIVHHTYFISSEEVNGLQEEEQFTIYPLDKMA